MVQIYQITQQQLDTARQEQQEFIYPGVVTPGEYTWNEADNCYKPVSTRRPASKLGQEYHGAMGIGGIGIYAENEMPVMPSQAAMARVERMEARARYCRRCGHSDVFDGAMFTTDAGGDMCDDCF